MIINDQRLVTEIFTASFNYDTQLYFGKSAEGGPPGYSDGKIAEKILDNSLYHSYLIRDEEQEIGIISIKIKEREVAYFCLIPESIGQGHGTQIWQWVESQYGSQNWLVETPDYSITNHAFYEKIGFIKVDDKIYGKEAKSFIYKKL